MLQVVNHRAFFDDKGRVFCRRLNKVVLMTYELCTNCPFCGGSNQGEGIECFYPDLDHIVIANPYEEARRVKKLIAEGVLPKNETLYINSLIEFRENPDDRDLAKYLAGRGYTEAIELLKRLDTDLENG